MIETNKHTSILELHEEKCTLNLIPKVFQVFIALKNYSIHNEKILLGSSCVSLCELRYQIKQIFYDLEILDKQAEKYFEEKETP